MWTMTECGYVRKTRVYIQVLAMGKKTQKRFHHQTFICSLPLLILYTLLQSTGKK